MNAPRYFIGRQVNVGYMGLVPAMTAPTNRHGIAIDSDYHIIGLRFMGCIAEDEGGERFISQPEEYEYLIASKSNGEYGWVPEGRLAKLGY